MNQNLILNTKVYTKFKSNAKITQNANKIITTLFSPNKKIVLSLPL